MQQSIFNIKKMNKLNYGIIGKNWGSKIFRILKKLNKNVIYLDIKSPKNYKNIYSYKMVRC